MKKATTFLIDDYKTFQIKMLNWVKPFNIFCLLDNSGYQFETPAFESLLAVGCKARLQVQAGNAFKALKAFSAAHQDWLFGHLAYDLKNETEQLQSNNADGIGFADLHFFVPEMVLQLNAKQLTIYCEGAAAEIFASIVATSDSIEAGNHKTPVIQSRFSAADYIQTIQQLQQHILRGDCYEINFCQEFFATDALIDPIAVYQKMAALSPNPFAALYKVDNRYCMGASPERYIKKTGNTIYSQPIKGTAKRFLNDKAMDESSAAALLESEKERSENVMVVDLVRNDLSKICTQGSVKVDELFGLYSFPQVHQLISTISGNLPEDFHWVEVLKATFPMGSMTGAPKRRVMELIENFEQTRRGLFSGAIGYVNPNGDFDFNVVIRSILYNAQSQYLSMQTGSAITFYSKAQKEYEECLLKCEAMTAALQ